MLKEEHLKIDIMLFLEHAHVRKVAFSIQCMKEHVNFFRCSKKILEKKSMLFVCPDIYQNYGGKKILKSCKKNKWLCRLFFGLESTLLILHKIFKLLHGTKQHVIFLWLILFQKFLWKCATFGCTRLWRLWIILIFYFICTWNKNSFFLEFKCDTWGYTYIFIYKIFHARIRNVYINTGYGLWVTYIFNWT